MWLQWHLKNNLGLDTLLFNDEGRKEKKEKEKEREEREEREKREKVRNVCISEKWSSLKFLINSVLFIDILLILISVFYQQSINNESSKQHHHLQKVVR